MIRAKLIWTLALLISAPPIAAAQGKRPITVDDLFKFKRVSDPQISPDGKHVAYVITSVDLPGNKTSSAIWLAPTQGGEPRQLTNAPEKKDRHPRWSPNGKHILFESNRSGSNQLWVIDPAGGEARQLTDIATEAATGIWSPDGAHIAFVSAVWPDFSEKPYKESNELNKKRKEEREKNPVKAKVFTKLFFRHWDEYVEDKRQHLFVIPFNTGKEFAQPEDVTPGDRDAYPTSTTFSVGDDFTFSPDGKYLVFTAVPEKDEAWSTNYDICRVPISGGTTKWECLTKDNPAADGSPRYSADGKSLAYRAQSKPGFEADKWQVTVAKCSPDGTLQEKPRSLTANVDRSADSIVWMPPQNGRQRIYYGSEERGGAAFYVANLDENDRTEVSYGDVAYSGVRNALTFSADGKIQAYLHASMQQPPEVNVVGTTDAFRPAGETKPRFQSKNLSQANAKLLEELDLGRPESITVEGADGTPMQMWILKPPGFDEKKKWPLVYLVHGGPQGAWDNNWSYRWNPQVWAAQGYVVALPNPRGSTGFGQKYVDEISGDWGGKCYEDLMKGVEYLEKLPYIDKDRMAAAGASFGGYMMNWFAGHTDKFKTLITHCGVYNFDSMYALTEELWFDEWEHGGPPWLKRDSYEKHSPHKFAKNFKTPMLIIHNDLDFRVPVAEGLQLFTTLQRLGVPSRMVNFPDEGHWVLKPANSKFWHDEVFTWLKRYVPPGGK
jgi:dipeptidyl aminopeptidase/acylaminoacyl peptidase